MRRNLATQTDFSAIVASPSLGKSNVQEFIRRASELSGPAERYAWALVEGREIGNTCTDHEMAQMKKWTDELGLRFQFKG